GAARLSINCRANIFSCSFSSILSVCLPGTDGQKLPLRRCAQPKPLSLPRHPDRQQRLQPHRPRVTGRFPTRRQDGQCFLAIAQRTSPRPPNGLLSWGRTVQKPNRVFPVVAGVETKFVQDHVLYPVPRLAVTLIDGSQVLPFRLWPTVTLLKGLLSWVTS